MKALPIESVLIPAPLPLVAEVRPMVVVCAWCPDKVQQEQAAQRHGAKVTHGICPRCSAEQLREYRELYEFPRPQGLRLSCAVSSATGRRDGR